MRSKVARHLSNSGSSYMVAFVIRVRRIPVVYWDSQGSKALRSSDEFLRRGRTICADPGRISEIGANS